MTGDGTDYLQRVRGRTKHDADLFLNARRKGSHDRFITGSFDPQNVRRRRGDTQDRATPAVRRGVLYRSRRKLETRAADGLARAIVNVDE
jgi:hypothetical protein